TCGARERAPGDEEHEEKARARRDARCLREHVKREPARRVAQHRVKEHTHEARDAPNREAGERPREDRGERGDVGADETRYERRELREELVWLEECAERTHAVPSREDD